MDNTTILIDEARKFLEKPRDVMHNLPHHEAVWKNCSKIVEEEKIQLDKSLLKIAAFWHDVVLDDVKSTSIENVAETSDFLRNEMKHLEYQDEDIELVIDAVSHHEFGDKPTNVYGLILQDADKLDVLSTDRWKAGVNLYRSGNFPREKIENYVRTGLKWIPNLPQTFHYQISKEISLKLIPDIYKDTELLKIVEEFNLQKEFLESQGEMSRIVRSDISLK